MLDVYTKHGWLPIHEKNNYYTDFEYGGLETLCFDVPVSSDILGYLKNEVVIRNTDNRYIIKQVNRMKTKVSYTCMLDLDDWKKGVPVFTTKEDVHFINKTVYEILQYIKPEGWQIQNAMSFVKKSSIELEDVTNYDILMQCQETFQVAFIFHVLNKEIIVLDPNEEYDTGLYITPQLNLKSIEWKGNSENFCTRLYGYGKKVDGQAISFASVNGGKEYIEEYQYTNKVIAMVWRDEQYETPEALLVAAKQKLIAASMPDMSYTVTVNDLASMYPEYDFLQFSLYKQVHTMVDENLSIVQRIVKIRKFHEDSKSNVITLSSVASKITSKIERIASTMKEDNQKLEGNILAVAKKQATQLINDFATVGYKYETENETYYLDATPKEKAQNVMRINLGGIGFSKTGWQGPYISAWTIDGQFNAEFITTGTLQAIKLVGNDIEGGTIRGSAIDTKEDLYIGNRLYLRDGNEQSGIDFSQGYLRFVNNVFTWRPTFVTDNTPMMYYLVENKNKIFPNGYGEMRVDFGGSESAMNHLYLSGEGQASLLYGTLASGSDRRLKEHIKEVDVDWINALHVVEFDYINGLKQQIGLIGQEYQDKEYAKYFLSKNAEGYYTIAYGNILHGLIAYSQQLQQRITKLEEQMKEVRK